MRRKPLRIARISPLLAVLFLFCGARELKAQSTADTLSRSLKVMTTTRYEMTKLKAIPLEKKLANYQSQANPVSYKKEKLPALDPNVMLQNRCLSPLTDVFLKTDESLGKVSLGLGLMYNGEVSAYIRPVNMNNSFWDVYLGANAYHYNVDKLWAKVPIYNYGLKLGTSAFVGNSDTSIETQLDYSFNRFNSHNYYWLPNCLDTSNPRDIASEKGYANLFNWKTTIKSRGDWDNKVYAWSINPKLSYANTANLYEFLAEASGDYTYEYGDDEAVAVSYLGGGQFARAEGGQYFINFAPEWKRRGEWNDLTWSLGLGLGVASQSRDYFFSYPKLSLQAVYKNDYALNLAIDGTTYRGGLAEILSDLPALDMANSPMLTSAPLRAKLELSAIMLGNLKLSLATKAEILHNVNNFVAVYREEMSNNSFGLLKYRTKNYDIYHISPSISLDYHHRSSFQLLVEGAYHYWSSKELENLSQKPRFVLSTQLNYFINRNLFLSLGYGLQAMRHFNLSIGGVDTAVKMKDFHLFQLKASSILSKHWSVSARASWQPLGERFFGYLEPNARAVFSVDYKF